MGQTVIGGLITSTLLTLFVVPVVYTILDDLSLQKVLVFVKRANILRSPKAKEKLRLQPGVVGTEEEVLGK